MSAFFQQADAFFRNRGKILFRIILIACFGFLFYGFLLTLRYWYNAARYPGEIDYSEPIILYESQLRNRGIDLYPGENAPYFTAANHGPLYYIVSSWCSSLRPDSYLPGRLLSLAGVLMCVVCFLFLTYRVNRSPAALFFAAMMSIFPQSVVAYGPVVKPDSFYIGLTFVGLTIAVTGLRTRLLYASIPFFAAALFVKPSALPAPAAAAIALFLYDKKKALIFCLWGAALCSVMLGAFWLAFGSRLLTHLFLYNTATYNALAGLILNPAGYVYFFYPVLFLACISYFFFARENLIALYFPLAVLIHIMLIGGKAGSTVNYWSEPTLALTLMISLGFAHFLQGSGGAAGRTLYLAGLILITALSDPEHWKNSPKREAYERLGAIRQTVRELAGSSRPAVYAASPGAVIGDGDIITLPIADTFLYGQHVLLGKNDGRLIEDAIRRKAFAFITINSKTADFSDLPLQERMLPRHRALMMDYYKLYKVLPRTPFSEGDVYFFIPK